MPVFQSHITKFKVKEKIQRYNEGKIQRNMQGMQFGDKGNKTEITKDDNGNWIHASCSDTKDEIP